MEIIDNINKTLKEDMMATLRSGSKVAIAASSFSIYAFQELKEQLGDISELRFIFTSPSFITEKADKQKREFYIPRLNRERDLYGSEFEIKLRNELSLKAVAKECADWIRKKVCFKSNRTNAGMPAFATVDDTTYMPLNGFTTVELGCERGNNLATAISKMEAPFTQQYLQIFNQIWNDNGQLQVVTKQVLDNITNAYKENSPEFIYFVTLYNIFNEFLEDISEDVLPNEATGFKTSVIWNKLYNFQRDAALAIINKLEKYNGCILADSVVLGKTFTALSVIKYYENRNKSVLVLCPKKLHDNWVTYRSNYVNNPLVADRLRYDILYHTDLSRQSGQSNGLDLEHINWGNYDLVVIDESHNFRNGGKVTTDENDENPRENRYLQLMNKVIRSGVKTKVLMLSATPVNNRFNDLRNQLALAYEGDSAKMDAKLKTTSSLDDIFRQAQTAFNKWSKFPAEQRTTASLLEMLNFDFFEVLDSVTIARSRRHIEQYYDTTDIGKFPERLKPLFKIPKLTDLSKTVDFNDIFVSVSELNLAIYTPSDFILPSKLEKYLETREDGKFGNLSRAGRERGIRQLMSINLLKRLESSVNSFRLTLERIRRYIATTIEAIDNLAARQSAPSMACDYDFSYGLDFDEREDTIFIGNKKTKIDLEDMDYIQWRGYLAKDLDNPNTLLFMLSDITPEHDSKLQMLLDVIKDKFANPINGDNKKVIVFTAFSDTAQYIYDLILRDKERLLSFDEPTRFIFSHSALREGWDNPNVFQICTLRHSDSTTAKRQEVGRGLRIAVDRNGVRQDKELLGDEVHNINVLTVIANESYSDFTNALQRETRDALRERAAKATPSYFEGKTITVEGQPHVVTDREASRIMVWLEDNEYIDEAGNITPKYHAYVAAEAIAPYGNQLAPMAEGVTLLINSIFDPNLLKEMTGDGNKTKLSEPRLNANFAKPEFQALWNAINHQYVYTVSYDTSELVKNAILHLNTDELQVRTLRYIKIEGQQDVQEVTEFSNTKSTSNELTDVSTSSVKYDLIGQVAKGANIPRRTAAKILQGLRPAKLALFRNNPEEFIRKVVQIIREQKASMIVDHIHYHLTDGKYDSDIFTAASRADFDKAIETSKHITDYVVSDSKGECDFAHDLDEAEEVVVYAKLPRSFHIPTPVGNYAPDWAIAMQKGAVKHIFFIAETKGSLQSMQLNAIENAKIDCCTQLFNEISTDNVKYHKVTCYQDLIDAMTAAK